MIEYKPFNLGDLTAHKRKALDEKLGKPEADLTSDFDLYCEVLKEIGAESWELFSLNGDTLGKRTV